MTERYSWEARPGDVTRSARIVALRTMTRPVTAGMQVLTVGAALLAAAILDEWAIAIGAVVYIVALWALVYVQKSRALRKLMAPGMRIDVAVDDDGFALTTALGDGRQNFTAIESIARMGGLVFVRSAGSGDALIVLPAAVMPGHIDELWSFAIRRAGLMATGPRPSFPPTPSGLTPQLWWQAAEDSATQMTIAALRFQFVRPKTLVVTCVYIAVLIALAVWLQSWFVLAALPVCVALVIGIAASRARRMGAATAGPGMWMASASGDAEFAMWSASGQFAMPTTDLHDIRRLGEFAVIRRHRGIPLLVPTALLPSGIRA
ncbi:hypothetical protein ABLE92_20135 [Gordonia sp. VNQ95]|uniref:hypothetical protein n=1 Tax=Gordonia TaxID=2053 RepID=UPI0032B410C1